jgi:putative phosphoesterase
MRVAVVSDVHGNLHALQAVLDDLERENVDAIVCCGDVEGPFGDECAALLERAGARFVRGNADEGVDWPLTVELEIDGLGLVLFCHGSPRSEHEILTRVSPENRVSAALAGVTADVVVHGHTHVQYDRRIAGRRVVNAGSVGMPYEGIRGAFWALLGPDVQLRRTDYDVEAAVAAIRLSGYEWAEQQVDFMLDPRDPDRTSAYFEGQAAS